MSRLGMPLGAVVAIIVLTVAAPRLSLAQQDGIPEPTVQDVDPGIDHGSSEDLLDYQYRRQPVYYRSDYAPGTIVVNTADRYLYLIQSPTRALRYGVGVGRDGFQWGGTQKISLKREWPDWVPPPEMIQRQPYLPRWMAGGPGNPLGARAMNLGNTVYRIHGTNAPETIGHAVSSGCIRLVNEDVIDLYNRVPLGTKVVVQHQ
ncbi:MAG: L,D-transpeptidase [Pseudolabrys sp.]|nr:L,D-transpeptidase [Pseudolabrys sp.]